MTADQALTWLTTTAQKTRDVIGNKGSPRPWNSQDIEAVHALQRVLVARAQPLTPEATERGTPVTVFTCVNCGEDARGDEVHDCSRRFLRA